jgi:hypothetical protein
LTPAIHGLLNFCDQNFPLDVAQARTNNESVTNAQEVQVIKKILIMKEISPLFGERGQNLQIARTFIIKIVKFITKL